MKRGEIFNFPKRSLAEVFLSEIRKVLRKSVENIGPLDSLTVAMNPTTATVLLKARNLHTLQELRDWLGVKAVITYSEMMDGDVTVWRDDSSPRFLEEI